MVSYVVPFEISKKSDSILVQPLHRHHCHY